MSRLIRTQVSLPSDLKRKAEQLARVERISLSEFVRRSMGGTVDRALSSREERARIAAEVKGISSHRSAQSAAAWIRSIRQERIRNDDRLVRLERTRAILSRRRAVR